MALVVKDRVKEVTTTTGTSNLTLGGAAYGFQSFAIIGNGNTTYYGIYDSATGDWEVGVGTYSTTGPTLTRDTVLESSNSGSKVVFGSGSKDVFCTYPAERSVYLDAAGSAVTLLDIGTLGVSTANITTANITAGTITTVPTNNTDIVNKQYADAIASGIHFHEAVDYATTAALPACTYSNGASGVGATLTGDSNGALTVDGYTFTSPADNGMRILVKNQANGAHNGVYTLSQAGNTSPGAPFILTRATDFDSVGTGVDQIDEGDFFLVTSGSANLNTAWVQQTPPPITIGTTPILFQQFAAPITYTAGTGLSESPSYTFNIANTGVTAATYGSASSVPVFAVNAQGQITSVTPTSISISAGAVSGLAPSATTDTTNASNITSGTLGSARLAGSYTGITGVGTLTAGTWTATAIGAAYGGTGQTSYAVGDLLYADTTTSLAKLADVVTGNALISGGVGTAPAWGKIGLQTHVSGTLQLTNGGTGATDATGARSNLGLVIGTNIPSVTGSGASGTWGINITGNAATATTATTSTTATSVSNSVTFNNSGSGAASGNGFNGSSALTVSYNTIGAPSTTGANASGTWGISITGNAATATNGLTTSNYVSYSTFTGAVTSGGNNGFRNDVYYSGVRNPIWSFGNATSYGLSYFQGASGLGGIDTIGLHPNGTATGSGSVLMVTSSYTQSLGSLRAPIFYDSDNTGYYVDPTGSTSLRTVGDWRSNSDAWTGEFAGKIQYHASNWYFQYASQWIFRNSGGTNVAYGDTSGNMWAEASMRSPIFYDSNNTGYYVDPASTTYLHTLILSGASYFRPNNWIQFDSTYGLYWPNNFGAHLHANDLSSYTQLAIRGSKNGYGGFYDQYSAVNGIMYDSGGNGGVYREASGRWYFYYNLSNDCMGIGTSSTSSTYSLYLNKGVYAQSRIDATIFYDTNNTGYYVDPASTSNLNVVAVQRAYAGYDAGVTGSFSCNNWFRSSGDTGWYNASYAGGIYMVDTTWVRVYGSKAFYVENQIAATGNVTAYYSDERLKTKVGRIENALDKVRSLEGFLYVNNDLAKANGYTSDKIQVALSAQQVQRVQPEVVSLAPFDMHTDEFSGEITSKSGENYLTVDYERLVPLLVEAIKELSAKVDALQ